jgi:WD40 repeat protein/tRNA A-37 threonylcarbamoyl transferase component Bud32
MALAVPVPGEPDLGPDLFKGVPIPGESRVIAHKYTIVEEIARGGMGVVYKARQENLNRVVAVKMLLGGVHASEDYKSRFLQEAKAAAKLNHPNIVSIHDWGEDSGQPFFSMDYIEGRTLADQAKDKPLPPRVAAELVRTLAQAMRYAHSQGILHRDLKPSNVLVDSAGVPHITDFGLARETNQETWLTATGDMLGTPGFLPPEQVSSKAGKTGPHSDVYGLGAILYYLLTSRPPHLADSAAEALRAVEENEPIAPRRLNPSIPFDLQTLCLKCLEKEPRHRYSSVASLARDLDHWLTGRPIDARPPAVWERVFKWGKRNQVKAGFSFALAVVVLAAGATVLSQWWRAEASARTNQELVIRSYVGTGMKSLADGEPIEAMPWLAGAARLTRQDPRAVAMNRFRLATALQPCHQLVQMFFYDEEISAAVFSHDGRWLATAHRDKTARVWDVTTGQPVTPLLRGGSGSAGPMEAGLSDFVEFSPDGRLLLASTGLTNAWLWDIAAGKPATKPLDHKATILCAAFSPDGRRVITGSMDGKARVWDTKVGRPLTPFLANDGDVHCACFSPDGGRLVTGDASGAARIWDPESGKSLITIKHGGNVFHAVFSPDSQTLLTASRDRGARLWDASTGAEKGRFVHDREVVFVSFSPDGTRFVSASADHTAQVWDFTTQRRQGKALTHGSEIKQATFSRDGRWVLTASSDSTARVWDASSGEPVGPPLSHGNAVTSAAFSPDGNLVLTASADHTARLWRLQTKQPAISLPRQKDQVLALGFSKDGRWLATAARNRTVRVWDAADGHPVTGELRPEWGSYVTAVDFDPSGRRLLTAHDCGEIRLWEIPSGHCVFTNHHQFMVAFAGFSPDGQTIVSAGHDRVARLWRAATGEPIGPPLQHELEVVHAAFSPDGSLVATASWDKSACIWNATNGQRVARLLGHADGVNHVAFSTDGRRLATASRDGTARLWDVATGRSLLPPLNHDGVVNMVAFSPDGRRVVTASEDRTARLWDLSTGKLTSPPLVHSHNVVLAVFSPEGRRLLTAEWDGSARLWDADSGLPISGTFDHGVATASLNPAGSRLATATLNQTAKIWTLSEDRRPFDYLLGYAEVLSNRRVSDAGKGLSLIKPAELQRLWEELRQNHPAEFISPATP